MTGVMGSGPRGLAGRYAAVLTSVALTAGVMLALTPAAGAASSPGRPPAVPVPAHLPLAPASCRAPLPGVPGQLRPLQMPGCPRRPSLAGPAPAPLRPSAGAPAWSVLSTPNPEQPTGSFSAVSCTSASACMAVGNAEASNGSPVMLAERWNGTAWAIQHIPSPAGSTVSYLEGVSCPSASACTAVGFYATGSGAAVMLAERWNGTVWASQPVAGPSGLTSPVLYAVSCPSASACTAVGFANKTYGSTIVPATLAVRWNGTAWATQSVPSPGGAHGSGLFGVSCPSASVCTAVGFSNVASGVAQVTLAVRWNGTAWATQSTVSPGGYPGSYLQGVSCTSASACTATGTYGNGSGVHGVGTATLAERWNGTAWTVQTTPSPDQSEDPDNLLAAVSCTSASACTAVGPAYTTSSGATKNLAERWNGTAWAIQTVPGPAGSLMGVSCPSVSACTATGSYSTSTGISKTLAEGWNAVAWATQPTPNPGGAENSELYGVSCPSAWACTAVGDYGLPGAYVPLAERWNGTSWAIQPVPEPAGAVTASLAAVSCSSASACTAVGFSYASGAYVPLAERWNGTSWAIQAVPSPSGGTAVGLQGVSCPSASACTAVGSYTASGVTVPLAERWNGTSWAIQTTPSPGGATTVDLQGVSCSSATACAAVGYYTTSTGTGGDVTLAERWNGTAWSIQTTPSPTADPGSYLTAVSCPSASSCTAVGYTSNYATETWVTLAESWNGTAWTVQPTPNPSSADGNYSQLTGVSCTSAGSCTATGNYSANIPDVTVTLAESWNGTAWAIQPTPNPSGAVTSYLYAVSCATASACIATGRYDTENGLADVTLGERYS
jgi:hypothetical protein